MTQKWRDIAPGKNKSDSPDARLAFVAAAKADYNARRRRLQMVVGLLSGALIILIAAAAYLFFRPSSLPEETVVTTTTANQTTTASKALMVVKSDDYTSCSLDDINMTPGEVMIGAGVDQAMTDPANEQLLFYVQIGIAAPQDREYFWGFEYEGRTIGEWIELSDLALGFYPYDEYNGDHGGNISVEAFNTLVEQAKTLDAAEVCQAARADYFEQGYPQLLEIQNERTRAEFDRLTDLGYRLFLIEQGDASNGSIQLELFSLLTFSQLESFAAHKDYGYQISWVMDESGVVNWADQYPIDDFAG